MNTAVQKALAASNITSVDIIDNGPGSAEPASKLPLASKKQKRTTVAHATAAPAADLNTDGVKQPTGPQEPFAAAEMAAKQPKKKATAVKLAKAALHSGDDLGDEFAIDFDAAEDAGVKKKSKSVISPTAQGSDGMLANKPKAKKAKHKVVQF